MTLFAQVTLLPVSGNGADVNVNGFAADAVGITEPDLDDWAVAIKDFYDDAYAAGGMRGIATNNHVVKFYDITLPQPNYPIYETTFNLATGGSGVDLPMELALCVSYKNTVNNAVPRARRRGRIYISGWTESVNTNGRPTSGAYQGLADGYATYVAAVNAITSLDAGVWSRADNVVYPIDEVWCDNEWDTVRRRGTLPTVRYSVSV